MQGPGFSRMELALSVYSPHSVQVAFLGAFSRAGVSHCRSPRRIVVKCEL